MTGRHRISLVLLFVLSFFIFGAGCVKSKQDSQPENASVNSVDGQSNR